MSNPVPSKKDTLIPDGILDAIRFAARYPEIFRALSQQLSDDLMQREEFQHSEEYQRVLRERYALLAKRESFQTGALAYWKDGLKNKLRPTYGEPAIVIEVTNEPFIHTDNRSDSFDFREPLDMQVGFLDEDGELRVLYVDSRRFTLTPGDHPPSPPA